MGVSMAINSSDATYLSALRSSTKDILRDVIGASPSEVILLDIPRHRNLGDSLIWKGELDYLRQLGHEVIHQADLGRHRDSDLAKLPNSAIILLHGGGNLGDLYPENDTFRRHIAKTFYKRRIVMLPQTIHYSETCQIEEALRDYSKAENLTMLLRESRSMELASEHFGGLETKFCYDLALGAKLPDRECSDEARVLTLARRDVEAVSFSSNNGSGSEDWSAGRWNGAAWDACIALGAFYKRSGTRIQDGLFTANQHVNRALLELNLRAALRQFSSARVVATDRLHAHVLSVLLGIPHVVTDNSYGKVSSIFFEYSGKFSTAHWAPSMEEAVADANNLAYGTPPEVG